MTELTLMSGASLKARARAALMHLALSTLVAAFAAGVVFWLWYPTPYREISGGRELFLLVVVVDVVIGPFITFFVFDQRKPRAELVRDLGVVALLQIGALAYGLHSVAQARPAVVALEGHRLRVVRAIDLAEEDLARAPRGLNKLPWLGPRVVATRPPRPEEKFEAIDRGLAGQDVGMRPEFWLPEAHAGAAYAGAAMPLERLRTLNAAHVAELDAAVASVVDAEQVSGTLGYLPILARRTDWSALVDRSSGRIVGYVPFEGF
jgi:hypothetical protein